jgi:hypothetical protein
VPGPVRACGRARLSRDPEAGRDVYKTPVSVILLSQVTHFFMAV